MTMIFSCKPDMEEEKTTSGDFWKNQTTQQILDPWLEKGSGSESGVFYTFMNQEWGPFRGNVKYPGMVARHIFSYTSGYMLTGDEKYLQKATELKNYLIKHGWDEEHGGWYNAIEETGFVIDDTKDMFYQIYAASGLTMYYFATHDSTAWNYLQKTLKIMDKKGWDKENKGYYRALTRELEINNSDKSITPQIAPISGYLLYLYMATKDDKYLNQSEQLVQLILDKMNNNEYNYVQEQFDPTWKYNYKKKGDDTEINIGHNLEFMWILLRLHDLTGKDKYLEVADDLWKKLHKYGYEEKNLAWYHRIGLQVPSLHTEATPWWIQAYGNMMALYYYHVSGKEKHLQLFDKGAKFWNKYFIDNENGGAVLSVHNDGKIQKGQKAVRTKTSYHSTEHGFLNYLYTNLWVAGNPVSLHFKIYDAQKGDKLYPSPVEDQNIKIQSVTIDGNKWEDYKEDKGYINLPQGTNLKVKVQLTTLQNSAKKQNNKN
jgi:mannose/cellobiose epimerase-like protein (N-acyl-D-glucosamine 2-epimerase family)